MRFNLKINDINYIVFFYLKPAWPLRIYIESSTFPFDEEGQLFLNKEVGLGSFNIKDSIIDWKSPIYKTTFTITEELKKECDNILKLKAFW